MALVHVVAPDQGLGTRGLTSLELEELLKKSSEASEVPKDSPDRDGEIEDLCKEATALASIDRRLGEDACLL